MDSCHLFNFIFGTKKATTELSRCFTNIGENVARGGKSASSSNEFRRQNSLLSTSSSSSSSQREQPPKSPLKQLQNKLTNFVSKVQKHSNEGEEVFRATATVTPTTATIPVDSKAELVVCAQSGTYKATLVRALTDEYEEEEQQQQQPEVVNCIVNPIHIEDSNRVEIVENPLPQLEDDALSHQNGNVTAPPANTMSEKDKHAVINHDDPGNEDKEDNTTDDKQATAFRAERIVFFEEDRQQSNQESPTKKLPERNDKRSLYVRNIVRSIESGSGNLVDRSRRSLDEQLSHDEQVSKNNDYVERPEERQIIIHNRRQTVGNICPIQTFTKPMTVVKPLPPKAPPKSFKAKCVRHQLSLNKPTKMQQLFQDEKFLAKLFDALEPLERCAAAQVCRKWRNILYSDHKYWKGLINVIDCTQLRREHLVECIVNTLQSAKMKQQYKLHDMTSATSTTGKLVKRSTSQQSGGVSAACFELPSNMIAETELVNDDPPALAGENKKPTLASDTIFGFDHEDVWRIQEICNRFALQRHNHSIFKPQSDTCNGGVHEQQQQNHPQICSASKSSSIPSQISSTFSSASLSSILSPLSESSRVETMKEKLYTSIDDRGFEAICLIGATDDDIEDLVCKLPSTSHERITVARLNNCSITNRGLDRFITSFHMISELEITGCNELTNAFDLSPLTELRRLSITDCINIADGLAQKLMQILDRLTDLTIQAYHLTDAFIEFLSMNCDTSKLQRLELPNCKEITNQSVIVLAKHFSQLELLSISGSTKVSALPQKQISDSDNFLGEKMTDISCRSK